MAPVVRHIPTGGRYVFIPIDYGEVKLPQTQELIMKSGLRPTIFRTIRDQTGADAETVDFGRRPTIFRPPYGNHDANTQRAAAICGMKAVVLWTAAVNDGVVRFQHGDHLNPGDIVLIQFRTTFLEDYTAFLDRARLDNLIPVPLPDFLG